MFWLSPKTILFFLKVTVLKEGIHPFILFCLSFSGSREHDVPLSGLLCLPAQPQEHHRAVFNPLQGLLSAPLCKEKCFEPCPHKLTSSRRLVWMQSEPDFMRVACNPLVGPVLPARDGGARLPLDMKHQSWQFHPLCFLQMGAGSTWAHV